MIDSNSLVSDEQDPLFPAVSLLLKLGSAIVHAEEAFSPDGRFRDQEDFQNLLKDPEVSQWMHQMTLLAFLPVKRVLKKI